MKPHLAAVWLLAAVLFCGCVSTQCNSERTREVSYAWEAECYVQYGDARMRFAGILGATYYADRPIQVLLVPGITDQLQFVVRHELLHVIGWAGHPHSGPDDTVVYMDVAAPADGSLPEAPSALEIAFVKRSPAIVWVSVADEELVGAVADAVAFWNGVAGRPLFRLRLNPATMK